MTEDLNKLIESVQEMIDAVTRELRSGKITWQEWLDQMSEILAAGAQAAAMLGIDEEDLPLPLLAAVEELVTVQFGYLDQFATEIATAGEEEYAVGLESRAASYANAIKVPYWKGKTKMLPLPAMPAQGTQCHNNCKCKWDVRPARDDNGQLIGYQCYWVRGDDDSCQTCVQREREWSPLFIAVTSNGPVLEIPTTFKHLSGQHNQQSHAGGKGAADYGSMSDDELTERRRAALRTMDEIEDSRQMGPRKAEYDEAAGTVDAIAAERDRRREAASSAAYEAVVSGDLAAIPELKKQLADNRTPVEENRSLDIQPVTGRPDKYEGPLQSEEVFDRIEKSLRAEQSDDVARRLGYKDADEMIDATMADVQYMLDRSDVFMAVPSDVLPSILSGGFRNQHETGTSRGDFDPSYRANAELNMFGIPAGSPASKYPKYGFLAVEGRANAASPYGDATIKFKQKVKERTTFTAEDSLEAGAEGTVAPAPYNKPRLAALGSGSVRNLSSAKADRPSTINMLSRVETYWEAQIHGDLTYRDIEKVTFSSKPDASLVKLLADLGIPYTVQ